MVSVLILLIFFFLITFTKLPILFFILLFYFGNSKSEIIIKCNIAYSFHKKYKYCIACYGVQQYFSYIVPVEDHVNNLILLFCHLR